MKKVISYFIKYPVVVNVVIIAFVVLGGMGYSNLKSSLFPLNDAKFISINIAYPGASPQEIEEGIVSIIENNLEGVIGVERVTSTASENSALITVETDTDYDVNMVLYDVKNAVDKVPNYPKGMEPPVVAKIENYSDAISFVLTGNNIPLRELKKEARKIESSLIRMDNISQVQLSGFPSEEIQIAVRERDLLAYNISFQEVANAISRTNILSSGGALKTVDEEYLIRVDNKSYYANELTECVVKSLPNGSLIKLKDVASVQDQFSESPNVSYYNGELSVRIEVKSTNREDLIKASEATKVFIENYNKSHLNTELSITRDTSITLKQRTKLLFENALLGMLLVFLFLALFLRPRLAFWVSMGLPVAFMGMFVFAGFFNVTINILSLFGMIIVIGILVDDGIVIAENIYREYEKGKTPIRAAIDGTLQVIPPILSAIVTTILAFSIFFFLDGDIGDFFGEVAIIVTLTLLVSLVEALIILPAHIAHSKALDKNQKVFGFNKRAETLMNFLRDKLYAPTLHFFMESVYTKVLGLIIPLVLLILTVTAFNTGIIRSTFFPTASSDAILVKLEMPEGTNQKITDSILTDIENKAQILNDEFTQRQHDKATIIQSFIRTIGPTGAKGTLRLNLLQGELRDFSADEISNEFQDLVGEVYGVESLTFGSGTGFGGKAVSVSLVGDNINELKQAKGHLKQALLKDETIKDITDTDPQGIKEIKIKLKDNAHALGLTLSDVITQVRQAYFGLEAQRFQRGKDEVKVWVRYNQEERASLANLENMKLLTPSGNRVAISEIANYNIQRGEVAINHLEGQREIKVEADMRNPKESASKVISKIKNQIMPEIKELYPSIDALYEGQNRQADLVIDSAKIVTPVVLLLIYIIIVFTFRSYSQPIMLLLMVPFSFIGVAWGHYIHGHAVNILSLLGIIALMGIVVNDGLVLISKLNEYLKQGNTYHKALIMAGKSRFRAIFLTSLTTIAGLAPLIFETSRQARILIPMAISITYGIIVATVLTLIVLPILLSFSNGTKVNIKWLWTGKKTSNECVERAIIELESEKEELH